jgi:hypothetical protein
MTVSEPTWDDLTPVMQKVLLALPANKRSVYTGHSRTLRALLNYGLIAAYTGVGTRKLAYASITDKGLALRAGKERKS